MFLASSVLLYRGADKSLARPGRKQARKHVSDARDSNNIEKRAVIKSLPPQDKAPKEIHTILTETLACFLPGRSRDLSAPLYIPQTIALTEVSCFNAIYSKSSFLDLTPGVVSVTRSSERCAGAVWSLTCLLVWPPLA